MAEYSKTAQEEVKKELHEFKKGRLRSGKSKKLVKNRKQAIAIGLSIARKKGAKVPRIPSKKKSTDKER
jgi:hypothetical protein